MKRILTLDVRIRYAFCALLMALSLFLLGSTDGNNSGLSRINQARQMRLKCQSELQKLSDALPRESRQEWQDFSLRNPELALRSVCTAPHSF